MYNAKLLYLMNERSAHTWQSSSSDQIWCMSVCTSRRGGDPKSKTYVSRCQKFVAWNGKGSAGLELAFWMHLRLNVSSFRCEFVVQNDELYIAGVRNKCLSWVSLVILWVQFLGGQSRWNCVACKFVDTLFSRGDLNRPENGGEAFVLSVVVMMMHVERPYTFVLWISKAKNEIGHFGIFKNLVGNIVVDLEEKDSHGLNKVVK